MNSCKTCIVKGINCGYYQRLSCKKMRQLYQDMTECISEKEIPKAPAFILNDWWRCSCGDSFGIKSKFKYCPNCGQKLLWED